MASQTISSKHAHPAHGATVPAQIPGHCVAEITIRTRHFAPHLENSEVAEMVARSVQSTFPILGIPVYAWCAMPDHLHLLIGSVAPVDLPRIVYNFIKLTGILAWRRFGIELWQWRHYRRIIEHENIAVHAEIIHDNPRRSGLLKPDEEYPWRSAPPIKNPEHSERRPSSAC